MSEFRPLQGLFKSTFLDGGFFNVQIETLDSDEADELAELIDEFEKEHYPI